MCLIASLQVECASASARMALVTVVVLQGMLRSSSKCLCLTGMPRPSRECFTGMLRSSRECLTVMPCPFKTWVVHG